MTRASPLLLASATRAQSLDEMFQIASVPAMLPIHSLLTLQMPNQMLSQMPQSEQEVVRPSQVLVPSCTHLGTRLPRQMCNHQAIRSEMGLRFMACTALRASRRRAGSRAVQWPACFNKSVVRLSRRATSPSSRLQSVIVCSHVLPDAHASTTPGASETLQLLGLHMHQILPLHRACRVIVVQFIDAQGTIPSRTRSLLPRQLESMTLSD